MINEIFFSWSRNGNDLQLLKTRYSNIYIFENKLRNLHPKTLFTLVEKIRIDFGTVRMRDFSGLVENIEGTDQSGNRQTYHAG